MTDYLDPSPRASKRRRTAAYTDLGSGLEEKRDEQPQPRSTARTSKAKTKAQGTFEDSAYGSKEDSLAEEGAGVANKDTKSQLGHSRNHSPEHQIEDEPEEDVDYLGSAIDSGDDNAGETSVVQPRSSGRERRRPLRYSLSPRRSQSKRTPSIAKHKKPIADSASKVQNDAVAQTTPRGILTPSKKSRGLRTRKSVLFDQDEKQIEKQLGFKDIQSTGKKSVQKAISDTDVIPALTCTSPETPSKKSRSKSDTTFEPNTESNEESEDDAVNPDTLIDPDIELIELDVGVHDISNVTVYDDPATLALKSVILERLIAGKSTWIPPHLQTQYDTLHSLLSATITVGESNSLLLLGARGMGKSHLIESVISDLSSGHHTDFHTIRLNGFYQTDDRLALREIWRQLGREMQVEEMENGELGGSYADTMSSLLSLLSHPDEFEIDAHRNNDNNPYRTSKSVIFILDEFDLFTTHPRQTLLYNLFDIAQSKKAPIAVVGCSTRVDVVDCLEKRVKSRFSHRWLHVSAVKTLDGFQDIAKNVLFVAEKDTMDNRLFGKDLDAIKSWNHHVQSIFLEQPEIRDLIQQVFYTTKSIPELLTALYRPVIGLSITTSMSSTAAFPTQSRLGHLSAEPALLDRLLHLPTLQLSLLIAASRLDTIHNLTIVNFNLVYAHYVELISRSKLHIAASGAVAIGAALRQWSRETGQSAWQDLGLSECIVPASGGTIAGSKDSMAAGTDSAGGESASVRMWRVEVTLEELESSIKRRWKESGGVRDVLLKWCKEI